jgi:Zn-dependent metalloprotease
MKRNPSLILLASIAVIIGALGWNLTSHANSQSRRKGEGAIMATESKGLANYDIRLDQAKESRMALESYRRTLSAQQVGSVEKQRVAMVNAKASLAARVPALQVSVNNALNTTEIVGVEGSPRFLTAPSSEKHEIIARNFLTQNAALYGLSATQAAQLKKIADYANPAGNLSWVGFKQEINGLSVFQGEIQLTLTGRGEIARTTGLLAPALDYATLSTRPKLNASETAAFAAQAIGVKANAVTFNVKSNLDKHMTLLARGVFNEDIKTELVYFPLAPGLATLAYSMTLRQDIAAYYILVDANTGRLLWRKNITSYQT